MEDKGKEQRRMKSDSMGKLENLWKRKRERERGEEEKQKEVMFKGSNKTQSSPVECKGREGRR